MPDGSLVLRTGQSRTIRITLIVQCLPVGHTSKKACQEGGGSITDEENGEAEDQRQMKKNKQGKENKSRSSRLVAFHTSEREQKETCRKRQGRMFMNDEICEITNFSTTCGQAI